MMLPSNIRIDLHNIIYRNYLLEQETAHIWRLIRSCRFHIIAVITAEINDKTLMLSGYQMALDLKILQ